MSSIPAHMYALNVLGNLTLFNGVDTLFLNDRYVTMETYIEEQVFLMDMDINRSDFEDGKYNNMISSINLFKSYLLDQRTHINNINNYLQFKNDIVQLFNNDDQSDDQADRQRQVKLIFEDNYEIFDDYESEHKINALNVYYQYAIQNNKEFEESIDYFTGVVRRCWVDEQTHKIVFLTATNFNIPDERNNESIDFGNEEYIVNGIELIEFKSNRSIDTFSNPNILLDFNCHETQFFVYYMVELNYKYVMDE